MLTFVKKIKQFTLILEKFRSTFDTFSKFDIFVI